MSIYTSERAEADLSDLQDVLKFWCENENPDTNQRQRTIDKGYDMAQTMMEGIVKGVQPEQILQLKVGEKAIKAVRFRRTAYDNLDMSWRELEPDAELELRQASNVTYGSRSEHKQELFVGWVTRVALSEVARTLTEGGELSLIGIARSARITA
jgi:hypothetical protein